MNDAVKRSRGAVYFDALMQVLLGLAVLSLALSSNLVSEKASRDLFGLVLVVGFIGGVIKWTANHRTQTVKKAMTASERWLLLGVIGFVVLSLAGLVNAEDDSRAWGKWGRNATFIALPFLFWVFKHQQLTWPAFRFDLKRQHPSLNILLLVMVLSSLMMAVEAIYLVSIQGEGRGFSQYNAIGFGIFTAVFALVLLGLAWVIKNPLRGLAVVGGICAVVACVYSQTRGAWLALVVAPIATAWFLGSMRVKWVSVVVLVAVVLGLVVVLLLGYIAPLQEGISNVQHWIENPQDCSSWGARLTMWKMAVMLASESPLFGVGITDWGGSAKNLVDQGEVAMQCAVIYSHTAHSIYFHTLATSGLVGVLGLGLLFVCLFFAIVQSPATLGYKAIALMLLLAYMVFGFSTTWLATSTHVSVFVVLMAYFMAQCHRQEARDAE